MFTFYTKLAMVIKYYVKNCVYKLKKITVNI